MYGVSFTSHRTLVSCDIIGLEEDSISWYFHTFIYGYDIAY